MRLFDVKGLQNEPIKVDRSYLEYVHRGLTLPAENLLTAVGRMVVVFDRDLEFTQHRVLSRDSERVELSRAIPWPR